MQRPLRASTALAPAGVVLCRHGEEHVTHWRDELTEASKSKAEREAEEQARQRARLKEALTTAEGARDLALEALRFTHGVLASKGLTVALGDREGGVELGLGEQRIRVSLDCDTAVLRVALADGKPKEFDFMKDRHVTASDVEEYIGRRAVELVRSAQKVTPW